MVYSLQEVETLIHNFKNKDSGAADIPDEIFKIAGAELKKNFICLRNLENVSNSLHLLIPISKNIRTDSWKLL